MESKIYRVVGLLWLTGILLFAFIKPPFWALMDDATNLSYIDEVKIEGKSLSQFTDEYMLRDRQVWGMFRPVYPAYVYVFYGAFKNHSGLAYGLNFLLVLGMLFGWAALFSKLVWREGKWLFFAWACAFTPHYNFLFFASLQEKLMLMGGLGLFGSLWASENKSKSVYLFTFTAILSLAFAFLSKATTLFMSVPVFFWLLVLTKRDGKRILPLWLTLIPIFIGSALFFSSIRGMYSSFYNTSNLVSKFIHMGPRFHVPVFFGLAGLVGVVIDWIKQSPPERNLINQFHLAFWPLGLLSYMAIMLPWKSGVGYYLLAPTGVFWMGTIIILYKIIKERVHPQVSILMILLLVLVSGFSAQKFAAWALQHHHARDVVQFIQNEMGPADNQTVIAMPEPCQEARFALSYFIGNGYEIHLAHGNQFPAVLEGTRKILIKDKYCDGSVGGFSPDKILLSKPPWYIYEEN